MEPDFLDPRVNFETCLSQDWAVSFVKNVIMNELGFENSSSRKTPLVLAEDENFLTTVITWILYVIVTPFVLLYEFLRQIWDAFWEYILKPVLIWSFYNLFLYPLNWFFKTLVPWVL